MLFEILDEKNVDHLRSHARAMIVSQSTKTSTPTVDNFDNQAKTLSGRFNISNDKFYSNRKTPQQAKSHTKKRALMGIKVVHSAPAHKLQTMKPVLSKYETSIPSCQILIMCIHDFSSSIVLQATQMNLSCFQLLHCYFIDVTRNARVNNIFFSNIFLLTECLFHFEPLSISNQD
jgi:hypothetical protein